MKQLATIGENIKKVPNKLGLTQDDLVRKSGVKHTTLTKIESDAGLAFLQNRDDLTLCESGLPHGDSSRLAREESFISWSALRGSLPCDV